MPAMLLAMLVVCATAAQPASATVQNACRYNYDAYYRDMAVDVSGQASIVATPPRYPAPPGTVIDPGQRIDLAGMPISVVLPADLPRFGYQSGLLVAGVNTIAVKVWVAIAATNTLEGVQMQGPLAVTASTTIEVDNTTDVYVSDTGFQYSNPSLAGSRWTAVGGDVAFGQAGPGTLGSLPVGPGGALRPVAGSVVIQADVAGGISFYMDCQPGATRDPHPNDGAGATFVPAVAAPFDATITGPRNVTCLNAQGRLVSGAAANLPAGVTREIDPIAIQLSAGPNASQVMVGAPYTLSGTKARVTIPADTVTTLANFQDPPGSALIAPGKAYPLELWVAIAGSNTVEGVQTVKVSGTYALAPANALPGPWAAYTATIDLPDTRWTAGGTGLVTFSIAQPGSMAAIEVTGSPGGDPLGMPVATRYQVSPYGSAVLRAGTERNATTLDCVPGAVSIADAAIAFSNLGRLAPPGGSGGRYRVLANPRPPVIAAATAAAAGVAAAAAPGQAPAASAAPALQASAPAPRPAAAPPAAAARPGPGAILSSRLTSRRGAISVRISCAGSRTGCAGRVSLRSAARLGVGGRRKVLTIAPDVAYTIKAGGRRAVVLRLGREARRLLTRRRALRVTITLKSKHGAVATRTVTLRR